MTSAAALLHTDVARVPEGLADVPFVAFDTETTGLSIADRLVEIAAVRFCGDRIEAEWSALVDPGVPIPEAATAIHGITDKDVAGRSRAGEVLVPFLQLIEGAALVAHHAPFDVRVLAMEMLRAGLALPQNPVLDTCAMSRSLALDVPNHRLGTLALAFGVSQGRPHRALDDARAAQGLLRAYLGRLGSPAEALVRHGLTQESSLLSFRRFAADRIPDSPLVAVLRRARIEGRAVAIVYRGGTRGTRPRSVTPRDIYGLGANVYVEAECHEDGIVKTFRLDRIAAARID
jgi:DNA polymerase-3 subunit epsilon